MIRAEIACIGTSWGGLSALRTIIGALPAALPLALVVIQHRHRESGVALSELLQEVTALRVREVEDKQPVIAGAVHVAPANYHLLIDDGHFALSVDEPVRYSRPSIDVTFGSVADAYASAAIGVILTGANQDGAWGLRRIVDRGGRALVQDPDTAESPIMPAAALQSVPEARRLTLSAIAAELVQLAGGESEAGLAARIGDAPAREVGR